MWRRCLKLCRRGGLEVRRRMSLNLSHCLQIVRGPRNSGDLQDGSITIDAPYEVFEEGIMHTLYEETAKNLGRWLDGQRFYINSINISSG